MYRIRIYSRVYSILGPVDSIILDIGNNNLKNLWDYVRFYIRKNKLDCYTVIWHNELNQWINEDHYIGGYNV